MAGDTGEPSSLPKHGEIVGEVPCKESRSARQRRSQIIRAKAVATAGDCSSCSKRVVNQGRCYGPNEVMSPCLSYGSASIIGRRGKMEDAVTEAPGFASATVGGGAAYDFFGVYDGHSGASVAWACRDRLHVVLAEEVAALGGWPRTEEQWRKVMAASFSRVDGELADCGEGSTAVVAVVGAESIVVANCGDSRAVISRGGMAVPLSSDHKADRPDEKERVEEAGGSVIHWDVYRVSGVLATSRSIGDHYLRPFVISDPEVTVTSRVEEDELIILASDGLWDVVSNEMASRVARKSLRGQLARKLLPERVRNQCNAAKAAVVLAELAYSRGSRDNISVVVVEL